MTLTLSLVRNQAAVEGKSPQSHGILARIIHQAFTPVYGLFWSLDKRLGVIGSGVACPRNLVA